MPLPSELGLERGERDRVPECGQLLYNVLLKIYGLIDPALVPEPAGLDRDPMAQQAVVSSGAPVSGVFRGAAAT
jgi:hypothetical protein